MKIELESIGTIHTEFKDIEGMPIQPTGAKGVEGKIVLDEKYAAGLKDLEDFSHIHLLYLLHKVEGYLLEVKPFMDNNTHGVFATRSPKRPNRIGSSVVKLDKIEENTIYISNIDVLDGTPLLDIKPYVPQLYEDTIDELKIGNSSFTLGQEAWQDGQLKVKGTCVLVHFDFMEQKSVSIPDDIRLQLEEHLIPADEFGKE